MERTDIQTPSELIIDGERYIKNPKFIGLCGHRVVDHYAHKGGDYENSSHAIADDFDTDCTHRHIDGFADEVHEYGCQPRVVWWCEKCYEYVELSEIKFNE